MSLVGKHIGPYLIQSLLGEGGMGDVYVGEHQKLNRPVAIKTLKPELVEDAELLQRFFSEARATNLIRHENIVEVTDLISEPDGTSYMVMELLDGVPLEDVLEHEKRLTPKRTVAIMAQVADALAAAHKKEIIHRDLKPANIFLIKRASSSDYVKVLDFGIARLVAEPHLHTTKTGQFWGTPLYMSPEQVVGKPVTPAADIYAFGVILFEMLTGQLPFNDDSLYPLMNSHLNEAPPTVISIVPEVPEKLSELVFQCMAKRPEDRPTDMRELQKQLIACVESSPDAQPPDTQPPGTQPPENATQISLAQTLPTGPVQTVASTGADGGHSIAIWIIGLLAALVITGGAVIFLVAGGSETQTPMGGQTLPDGGKQTIATANAPSDARPEPPQSKRDGGAMTAIDAAPPSLNANKLREQLTATFLRLDEIPTPKSCQTQDAKLLAFLLRGYSQKQPETPVNASETWQASTEFWTWQAWRYVRAGLSQQAQVAALRAITICEDNAAAHNLAGKTFFLGNQLENAAFHYETATRLAPNSAKIRYNVGLVQLGMKHHEAAIKSFEAVRLMQPDYKNLYLTYGQALLFANKPDKALAALLRATTLQPKQATAWALLGLAYRAMGQDKNSTKAFCQAADLGHAASKGDCPKYQ